MAKTPGRSRYVAPKSSTSVNVAVYAGGGTEEVIAPKTGDVVSLRPVVYAAVQAARRVLA